MSQKNPITGDLKPNDSMIHDFLKKNREIEQSKKIKKLLPHADDDIIKKINEEV